MFRKKDTGNEKTIDTIIGPATIIEGNITHPKSLRIDGKIIGEVHCEGDVFIGKTGYVEPLVNARNLNIAGEINGDVTTIEKVHLMATGRLSGSVTSKGIIIDEGGVFNGKSVIKNEVEPLIKSENENKEQSV